MDFLSDSCDATALRFLRDQKRMKLQLSRRGMFARLARNMKNALSMLPEAKAILHIVLILFVFFILWRVSGVMVNCGNPLVVVLSGSMEPAYHRGDLLLLHKVTAISITDIIVFNLPGREIPIVHRVHAVHEDAGKRVFLTKGDNNDFDDRTLYPEGYRWVKEEDAVGKVFVIVPRAGFLTILSEQKPWVKAVLLTVTFLLGCFSGI